MMDPKALAQEIVVVQRISEFLEIIDCESETHEVEPSLAFESEFTSSFICKFLDE